MIKKYRKKPIVVDALQFNNENFPLFCEFLGEKSLPPSGVDVRNGLYMEIRTLEGIITAREGDYIVKGVRGEFYPVRKDIFEETYEEVQEERVDLSGISTRELERTFGGH